MITLERIKALRETLDMGIVGGSKKEMNFLLDAAEAILMPDPFVDAEEITRGAFLEATKRALTAAYGVERTEKLAQWFRWIPHHMETHKDIETEQVDERFSCELPHGGPAGPKGIFDTYVRIRDAGTYRISINYRSDRLKMMLTEPEELRTEIFRKALELLRAELEHNRLVYGDTALGTFTKLHKIAVRALAGQPPLSCPYDNDGDGNCSRHPNGCP